MIVPDGETAAYARSHGSPGSGPLVGKRTLVTGASRPSALPWPWHMRPGSQRLHGRSQRERT